MSAKTSSYWIHRSSLLVSLFLILFGGLFSLGFTTKAEEFKQATVKSEPHFPEGPIPHALLRIAPTPDPNLTPHTLVGSFYTERNGFRTRLLLNNKGISPVLVYPTLYSASGVEFRPQPVNVPPSRGIFINLRDWIDQAGESFSTGNIKIFHHGMDLVIGAQVYVEDTRNGLSFEEKLIEMGKFDSRKLEGIWFQPRPNTTVKVALSNTTDDSLSISANLTGNPNVVGQTQEIVLSAHETKLLDLHNDFLDGEEFSEHRAVALSLQHTGDANALLARAVVYDRARGYSNTVQFYNPTKGQSRQYHGAGLRLKIGDERLRPIIVVRNTLPEPSDLIGRVPYTREDGTTGIVRLPNVRLQPNEVRLINTQAVVDRNLEENIKIAGIEFEYSSIEGSVQITAHSVSDDGDSVFRVPMYDPLAQKTPTGGYPFRIREQSSTIAYLKNITDVENSYVAFLILESGMKYMIGLKTLKPHQTIEIDFKNMRDEQIPDEKGVTIPLGTKDGQFQWTLKLWNEPSESDPYDELAIVGRSEQIDTGNKTSSNYSCQNWCIGSYVGGFIIPSNPSELLEIGKTIDFQVYAFETTSYEDPYEYEIYQPYATWSSSNTSAATITSGGRATVVGAGTTSIKASFYALIYISDPCSPGEPLFSSEDLFGCNLGDPRQQRGPNASSIEIVPLPLRPPCGQCYSIPFPTSLSTGLDVVAPTVASIAATIASTKNPAATPTPAPGVFTTQNAAIAYPTETSTDVMVVFQNPTETIGIAAQGISPPSAAASLKWKIERNPSDTVATGTTPTLSTQTGAQLTLTPTTAGSFRLICYFDTNANGNFDAGEELRVLLLAIVRVSVNTEECTIGSQNVSFQWSPVGSEFSISSGSPMSISCEVIVEGGGSSRRVGPTKVHFGNVGNLTSDPAKVNYVTSGTATENPGAALPMVDTGRVTSGSQPTGGDTAFRGNSNETPNNAPGGGQSINVTSDDSPGFGLFKINHPSTNNLWATTQGGYDFTEFIAGYSVTFPRTYVVAAKATWTVRYLGNRTAAGVWANNGSGVTLQGSTESPANLTFTVSNGSPQTGNTAGLQVLGLSFVNQHTAVYSQ